VTITLPFPPSVNTLYATVNGRRVLSKRGREYKNEVGYLILSGGYTKRYSLPMAGRLMVGIQYFAPTRRKLDLMNFNKALLDAFSGIVYEDDSQIDDIHQKRGEVIGKPGKVVVRVVEI